MSLADIRRDYLGEPLSETDSDPDPFAQFARWLAQARDVDPDPTTMALATATIPTTTAAWPVADASCSTSS